MTRTGLRSRLYEQSERARLAERLTARGTCDSLCTSVSYNSSGLVAVYREGFGGGLVGL
jgi:hypothetical protein